MTYKLIEVDGDKESTVIETGKIMGSYSVSEFISDFIKPTEDMAFGEDHVIRISLIPIVEKLRNAYKEYINHIVPENILIMENTKWKLSEKASENTKVEKINIRKATPFERLSTGYDYVLMIKHYFMERWSEAQIHAAIMSQLLRINPNDSSIIKYTEDHYSRLLSTFGEGYLDKDVKIVDILESKVVFVGFKRADNQVRVEEFENGSIQDEAEESQSELREDPYAIPYQLNAPDNTGEDIVDVEFKEIVNPEPVVEKARKPVQRKPKPLPVREAE